VAGPKGLLRLGVSFSLSLAFCHSVGSGDADVADTASQAAASKIEEMAPGTKFQPVLDDTAIAKEGVKRLILLTGKLYYELIKERAARGLDNVAFVRIEELAPFPFEELSRVIKEYQSATGGLEEVVWVQEEPRNQGAWGHVQERIREVLQDVGVQCGVRFVGRKESAVPAPGVGKMYAVQQKEILEKAFEGL